MASFRRDLGSGTFFLKPCGVLPDLRCTSVHEPPPAGGDLLYAAISPSPVPNLQFRSMFCNADPSRIQVLEGFTIENFERNRF